MPLLDWLNKSDAVRTVQKVPYRLLEALPELSSGDSNTENMLIQGDNLLGAKYVCRAVIRHLFDQIEVSISNLNNWFSMRS